jgi:hypothetical protein
MNYVYSLSIRTHDDHALCLFGVISFCCYFLLFGFKLIYLFVIMNQLASTTIFIILVDDELDDYFQRFFLEKWIKSIAMLILLTSSYPTLDHFTSVGFP